MSARAGRPSQLKPIPARVSSVLAYQAESTAGLTPRTPFSSRPAEVGFEDEDDEEDCLEVKVHPSPSAPITPVPRRRSTRPRLNNESSASSSGRRWRLVTWSSVLALIVIVLLSLYNVDPRHVLLPQAHSDALTEWIDVVSQDANGGTTVLAHPTRTIEPLHLTEAARSSSHASGATRLPE
ncbi:hypothetical protein FS749_008260 [Ceratobasidium sp. UAMH 11750]|nr:hypothetical protein FS749_008260 [Ceratobasidium sp. UAMH 11750]